MDTQRSRVLTVLGEEGVSNNERLTDESAPQPSLHNRAGRTNG